MSKFLNAINTTYTENGALTNASTGSSLLDYFGMGSALRERSAEEKYDLFLSAYNENSILALKALFYSRDPRGGQGERDTFRDIFVKFALHYPEESSKLVYLIPELGRWDDLINIAYRVNVVYKSSDNKTPHPLVFNSLSFINDQLHNDNRESNPSLLAKWMPSVNTSSKETRAIANWLWPELFSSQKSYRKALSSLRRKIKVVEQQMSANQWTEIDYERVSSQAARIYCNAFLRHDSVRYNKYLYDVRNGDAKINSSVTFPYEIVREVINSQEENETLELLWKNLPDYTEGREDNSIVVCDTSGSMYGHPITVSISLAIYFAERNKGEFKDHFITFSEAPKLQKIKGDTLFQKVNNLEQAKWGMNTNIQAVFGLILNRAVEKGLTQKDLPSKIIIISDMEFDEASQGYGTNFEVIDKKFQSAGFIRPELVFWNVNSRNNQSPITIDDKGVKLVSGASPSTFKALMTDKTVSAYDLMIDVLNQKRYNKIETFMK